MRAFVVTGPHRSEVRDVEDPAPAPGQVVVDIDRVGVCGTDVELYTGEMAYLHQGHAAYPIRLGHEWSGTVSAVGDGVDPGWMGRRTTGDTMLGCGRCDRCRSGRPHVCDDRYEVGIRRGFPGALAERMAMPVTALNPLPDAVDDVAGAMVEPGGSALRSVWAAGPAAGGAGPGARPGHHRPAGRAVRARARRGGARARPHPGVARLRHGPWACTARGPRRTCPGCRLPRSSTRRTRPSSRRRRSSWSSRAGGWC